MIWRRISDQNFTTMVSNRWTRHLFEFVKFIGIIYTDMGDQICFRHFFLLPIRKAITGLNLLELWLTAPIPPNVSFGENIRLRVYQIEGQVSDLMQSGSCIGGSISRTHSTG